MLSVPNIPHIPNGDHYKNHYKTVRVGTGARSLLYDLPRASDLIAGRINDWRQDTRPERWGRDERPVGVLGYRHISGGRLHVSILPAGEGKADLRIAGGLSGDTHGTPEERSSVALLEWDVQLDRRLPGVL